MRSLTECSPSASNAKSRRRVSSPAARKTSTQAAKPANAHSNDIKISLYLETPSVQSKCTISPHDERFLGWHIAPEDRSSTIAPPDIIGRWGLASYHREQDRARTEAAARGQCKQPYLISGGQAGGVMMLGHDSPNIVEHLIKATADGKTYLGPGADPGGADDREVVSFDGRVLVLKWVVPEVQGRYGIMVLVRCGAEGTAPPPAPRRAAAPARAAAPPPPVMTPPPAR